MQVVGRTMQPSEWAPKGKFVDTTTFGEAFTARAVEPSSPFKPKSQTVEQQPFRGTSSYADDFQPKSVPYSKALAPPANPQPTGPFLGGTTYGSAYQEKEIMRPQTARPAVTLPPSQPFEGSSLYKETFRPHGNARRDPCIPIEGGEVMPRNGQFDNITTSRVAYQPKEIQRTEMFRPAPARPMSAGPFNGSSEYRNQYIGKESPTKAAPHVPVPSSDILGKGKFDDSTTSKAAFAIPSDHVPARSYKPEPSKPDSAPFNGTSTYTDAFIAKDVPYELVKPKNNFKPSEGRFDGTTSHQRDYIPISVVPAKSYKPVYSKPDTAPFSGLSTYNDAFVVKAAPRTESYKPANQTQQSAPFQGQSSYKTDYVAKEIPYSRPGDCSECSSCADDEEFYSRPF